MEAKEAVKEAVHRELELGKFVLAWYSTKLSEFEKEYGIKTEKFVKNFEGGKLGDEEDYFEWFAVFRAKTHWEEKLRLLSRAA